ncbi:MAG: hypothetical protein HN597_17110 [Desulfobacula sp.]|uniref:hypothetical protein n=1 Tax=Desulfobacula sp. TaxID=2593537 RepID=UPI0039B8A390|nr:hypothetical protein [Desulfobacula sp.]
MPKRIMLGEILVRKKKLTPEKLFELLEVQSQTAQSLGTFLSSRRSLQKRN